MNRTATAESGTNLTSSIPAKSEMHTVKLRIKDIRSTKFQNDKR